MTARRQSLPDTIDDIRKADAYVMSRLNFKFLTPTWRRFYDRLSLSFSLRLYAFVHACLRLNDTSETRKQISTEFRVTPACETRIISLTFKLL